MKTLPALALVAALLQRPDGGDALHAPFSALLAEFVRGSGVDYAGLHGRAELLDAYLAALGRVDPRKLPRDEATAFWINAYNAFTLRLVLDHHGGIESIKDIPADKRWEHERWRIAGRAYSLDAIEHQVLRPLGDARIHFALNCASKGCPDLRAEAYLPSRLDEQLDDATRRFLADTAKGLREASEPGFLGGEDHNLYLSRLFDWYEQDFVQHSGSVVKFVLRYAPQRVVRYIQAHRGELDVEFLDYDWSLDRA